MIVQPNIKERMRPKLFYSKQKMLESQSDWNIDKCDGNGPKDLSRY